MKPHYCLVFLVFLLFSGFVFAQDVPSGVTTSKGFLLGPGDQITATIQGERDYDFIATIDEDGRLEVPFADKPVMAQCMTERDLRLELTKLLEKYLRSPQVNIRVSDRKSRPPAVVYGEVQAPGRVEMLRKATLVEVLAFSGGVKDEAGGLIQVIRPQPPMCIAPNDKDNWKSDSPDPTVPPSRTFSLSNIKLGLDDSNPVIYPGDVIYVHRAPLVYVTGEVLSAQGIYLKDGGLSLKQAIAKVGGPRREARTKAVTIQRLKPGTTDQYDIITANYDLISKGQQKDIMLQPYDIVVVDQARDSVAMQILKVAIGAGKAGVGALATGGGYRVLY